MNFKTTNENIRTNIKNVVGTIRGAIEPDRYVIIGTHRDAFVYGATDPLAGTAAMMEIMVAIRETMRVIHSISSLRSTKDFQPLLLCSMSIGKIVF